MGKYKQSIPVAVTSVKLIVTRISEIVTPLLLTSRKKSFSFSLTVNESPTKLTTSSVTLEGGREGGRVRGREGGWEGGRLGGREGERGGREGERGGREGGMEEGRVGGREGWE